MHTKHYGHYLVMYYSHSAEQVKLFLTEGEKDRESVIRSVRGSNRRRKGDVSNLDNQIIEEDGVEEDDSTTSSEDEENDEIHEVKVVEPNVDDKECILEPPEPVVHETSAVGLSTEDVKSEEAAQPEIVALPTVFRPVNRPSHIQASTKVVMVTMHMIIRIKFFIFHYDFRNRGRSFPF